jgi:dolichol-phosphate mannosyltransferase
VQVTVILPTYNEAGNILGLIDAIRSCLTRAQLVADIVVVDDNSPDGTGTLVRQRYADDPAVRTVVRTAERGLATAIRAGIEQARGDVVVVMDTDFNHEPAVVPRLVRGLESADVVVGSRFIDGGGMEERARHYSSLLYNLALRAVVGSRFTDNLSGFFAVRRDLLVTLPLDAIFYGYGDYFIRLLYAVQRLGLRFAEVPVYYRRRDYGVSKTRFVPVFVRYSHAVMRLRRSGLPPLDRRGRRSLPRPTT